MAPNAATAHVLHAFDARYGVVTDDTCNDPHLRFHQEHFLWWPRQFDYTGLVTVDLTGAVTSHCRHAFIRRGACRVDHGDNGSPL